MDGIHDMGGMRGFGHVQQLTAAPPFAEPWEGKAFVIGALAARISGTNLHAFRHAIERVPPREYLAGYWNRRTIGAQTMMEDSGIITDEEVPARAARLSGLDVPEPPPPTPHKPQMPSGLPPSWYKDPAYRSRVVREPRQVLREFAGWNYYECWLRSLERVVSANGLVPADDLRARLDLLAARPKGHDHRHDHGT